MGASVPLPGSGCLLNHLLFIDDQFELQVQPLRRFAAQEHTLHENLKIIHDGAVMRIDCQFELDQRPILIDFQL